MCYFCHKNRIDEIKDAENAMGEMLANKNDLDKMVSKCLENNLYTAVQTFHKVMYLKLSVWVGKRCDRSHVRIFSCGVFVDWMRRNALTVVHYGQNLKLLPTISANVTKNN